MALTLPDRPAKYFIEKILAPSWDPADAKGYDLGIHNPTYTTEQTFTEQKTYDQIGPGDEEFVPVATTIDDVGSVYPSVIIQYSNETSGGQSSYDYLTPNGPGQNRTGTLLATVRAQESDDGYTGDADRYDAEPADDIVVHLVQAVENACQRNAAGGSSEFETIGSQRGPDAPDDSETNPTTRIENTQILYSWLRQPER